jgi:phosphatidate cytidylyltransferase
MAAGSGVSGLALADSPARWADLTRRVLSAAVLLPVAIVCVWAGGGWFLALTAVALAGLAMEWGAICGYPVTAWPGVLLPMIIVVAAVCAASGAALPGLLVVMAGAVAVMTLPSRPLPDGPSPVTPAKAAASGMVSKFNLAFGFPYLGLAAIALPWLRADPAVGWPNALFMLSIIWASDIGAYVAGRLIGGPKLAPAISPGKTWSGAAGGLVSAAVTGIGVAACLSSGFSPSHVAKLAIGLGVISQAGDLLESALKRHFGVKDSGRIIPGHGGLLDRLDAVLAVAPVTAVLAFSVGRGVVLWR